MTPMQPSDPTTEEREIRQGLECCLSWLPTDESERLDAYARAVYERGVRDSMARVAHTRSVYTNNPESDFATGWHEACDAISRFLRALTPPEPTDAR